MREIASESWVAERAPDISLRDLAAPLFRRKHVPIAACLAKKIMGEAGTKTNMIVILFGLAFATVLAIAMAYLVEYFDSSFHTQPK
jgi:hypothetical protein